MYWWNLRALKAQLAQGPLPQPAAFRYAAAYATLGAVGMVPVLSFNRWDALGYVGEVVITLCGTIYCYRMNRGPAGQHFLDRYFSLGLVVVIRLLPAFFLIFFAVLALQDLFGGGDSSQTTPVEVTASLLFLSVAY